MKILFFLVNDSSVHVLDNLLRYGIDIDIIIPEGMAGLDFSSQATSSYANRYITNDLRKTAEHLFEKNNYTYIFPTFGDRAILMVAELNKKFNLPGISPDVAELIYSKISYYDLWDEIQIPVPTLYGILESCETLSTVPKNIKYPCIVKPSVGTGGVGIQIIEDQQSLINFFADTEEQLHRYQERHGSNYKKLQYFSGENQYMIQAYVDGDVISFIGHVYKKQISLDFIYDIESESYPYAAETGFKYPSRHASKLLHDKTIKYLQTFFDKINFDNSPFMLDVILDANNQIYFIDFSPRLSMNGGIIMWHAGEKDYGYKLMNKLLHGIDFTLSITKTVLFRQLPFNKKKIKHIEINKNSMADVISLPKGQIQLVRNDLSVRNNGYVILTGDTPNDVEEKYRNFVAGLVVEYD